MKRGNRDPVGQGRRKRAGGPAALLVLAAVAVASMPAADAVAQAPLPSSPAAPYLQRDDPLMVAVLRLESLGVLPPGHDPTSPDIDRVEVGLMLHNARAVAREMRPDLLPMIRAYLERLEWRYPASAAAARRLARDPDRSGSGGDEDEAGGAGDPAGAGDSGSDGGENEPGGADRSWELDAVAGVGYRWSEDYLAALGAPDFPQEPPERVIAEGLVSLLGSSGFVGSRLAWQSGVTAASGDVEIEALYGVLDLGSAELWGGWRNQALGHRRRGVVLAGTATALGGGLATEAFRLPWVLRHAGPLRLSTSVGRTGSVAPYDEPWLWVFRASLQPHRRLTIGLNRAAMVGVLDEGAFQGLKHLVYVLIGKHGEGEANRNDNHVASVELRYRPPVPVVPLTLHLEWGLEDSAGAWRDVPGVVAGAYVGAVPGAAWLGAGLEYATFGEMCCGNPWWYRHRGFAGGWAVERVPLAHPLGGHGREWAAHADAALLQGRLVVSGRAYHRWRGGENLLSPALEGKSVGGLLELSALTTSSTELRLRAGYEDGAEDWTRSRLEVMAVTSF